MLHQNNTSYDTAQQAIDFQRQNNVKVLEQAPYSSDLYIQHLKFYSKTFKMRYHIATLTKISTLMIKLTLLALNCCVRPQFIRNTLLQSLISISTKYINTAFRMFLISSIFPQRIGYVFSGNRQRHTPSVMQKQIKTHSS